MGSVFAWHAIWSVRQIFGADVGGEDDDGWRGGYGDRRMDVEVDVVHGDA